MLLRNISNEAEAMSRFWIITKETESLLTFKYLSDLVTFLYDHQDRMDRFRVVKNKDDHVVEVHLKHLPWSSFREVLERS